MKYPRYNPSTYGADTPPWWGHPDALIIIAQQACHERSCAFVRTAFRRTPRSCDCLVIHEAL